jgi:glycosyltransferase 2 family protein
MTGGTGPSDGDTPHVHQQGEELVHGESVLDVMEESQGDVPRDELVGALSLVTRLKQPRTIISIALPLFLLVLLVVSLPGFKIGDLSSKIVAADPAYLIAAVLIYYAGFPLRGLRWSMLLRGAGAVVRVIDATEIIFISWLVNCLVPAKLGDIYRAYLLKINSTVSLSRTFGTVFMERVLDLFAIVTLALAAGFVSFREGMTPAVRIVFVIGLAVVFVLLIGLLTMRNFGRRLIYRLPFPHTVRDLYDRFEEGVFGAIALRHLPALVIITGLIWATEGLRVYFVIQALGFSDVHLGVSGAFFVALAGSLLTAVPLTPAGLGIVELGVAGLLTVVYGVSPTEAGAIILVDRAISVLSVIVLGSIAYVFSPLRRGRGLRNAPPGAPPAPDPAAA